MQGVQRVEHLPARSGKEQVQGVRRGGHLPARSDKEPVQGVRRGEHLPARSEKEQVQGVRRGEHLPAQSDKEQVQDVHCRQGRVHAAGSRGALISKHTGVRQNTDSSPFACGHLSCFYFFSFHRPRQWFFVTELKARD